MNVPINAKRLRATLPEVVERVRKGTRRNLLLQYRDKGPVVQGLHQLCDHARGEADHRDHHQWSLPPGRVRRATRDPASKIAQAARS